MIRLLTDPEFGFENVTSIAPGKDGKDSISKWSRHVTSSKQAGDWQQALVGFVRLQFMVNAQLMPHAAVVARKSAVLYDAAKQGLAVVTAARLFRRYASLGRTLDPTLSAKWKKVSDEGLRRLRATLMPDTVSACDLLALPGVAPPAR